MLLALVFLLAWNPLNGTSDLFAHAAVGQWIIDHHAIPRRTLFLWSASQPWVAHSWLSEVFASRIMPPGHAAGIPFAVGGCCVLICAAFAACWLARPRGAPVPASLPILFCFGALAAANRFQPRPEAFSDLFTALTLLALIRARQTGESPRSRPLLRNPLFFATLATLFALWTNLHGGVLAGVVLIGLTAACDSIQDRFDADSRRLLLLAGVCLLAMLVNPYGWRYFTVYTQIDSQVFTQIGEWFPPLKAPMLQPIVLVALAAVTAAALAAAAAGRPIRLAHLAWLAYGIVSFAAARRNSFLLDLICLSLLAAGSPQLTAWETALRKRLRRPGSADGSAPRRSPGLGAAALQALVFVFVASRAEFVTRPHPLQLMRPDLIPSVQADLLADNHVNGPLFNDYNSAAYLEWRLYGRNTFFIDGMNAYGYGLVSHMAQVLIGAPEGFAYLDGNRIDCIVGRGLQPGESEYPPLYVAIFSHSDWILVSQGPEGPMWLRKTEALRHAWSQVPSGGGAEGEHGKR